MERYKAAFNKTGLIDENNVYSNDRCGIVVTALNAVVSHNNLTSNGNVKIGIGGGGISATILENGNIVFKDNYICNSTSKNSGNGIYALTSTTGNSQFINNTVLNWEVRYLCGCKWRFHNIEQHSEKHRPQWYCWKRNPMQW